MQNISKSVKAKGVRSILSSAILSKDHTAEIRGLNLRLDQEVAVFQVSLQVAIGSIL